MDQSFEDFKAAVREALAQGCNIREQMRDITIEALQKGRLDSERIKVVLNQAFDGINVGLGSIPKPSREKMAQAVHGIDDAMSRVAEAMRQSIQRSRSRVKDFSDQDLSRAMNDMKSLDAMFMESLRRFAMSSGSLVKDLAQEVYEKMKAGGTKVGATVSQSMGAMNEGAKYAGREGVKRSFEMAFDATAQIADMASGILSGLAESMRSESAKKKEGSGMGDAQKPPEMKPEGTE